MGSAPSGLASVTRVEQIRPSSERSTSRRGKIVPRETQSASIGSTARHSQGADCAREVTRVSDPDSAIIKLKQQIATLESENRDLRTAVNGLEETVRSLRDQGSTESSAAFTETLQLKDRCIARLEKETSRIQEETAKLRSKYKRKLRSALSELATSRQDHSLRVFELKDEITKLSEENATLQKSCRSSSTATQAESKQRGDDHTGKFATPDEAPAEDDIRTGVILALSEQISEQNSRICELQEELETRERQLAEMEAVANTGSNREVRTLSRKGKTSRRSLYPEEGVFVTQAADGATLSPDDDAWQSDALLDGGDETETVRQNSNFSGSLEALNSRQSSPTHKGRHHLLQPVPRTDIHGPASAVDASRQSSAASRDSGWEDLALNGQQWSQGRFKTPVVLRSLNESVSDLSWLPSI